MAEIFKEPTYNFAVRRLRILLVCSFIVTGMFLLSELMSAAMMPSMTAYFEANPNLFPEEFAIMMDRALSIPQWYYLLTGLLDAVSIIGLILMWRLSPKGFHCYTLSKLLLIMMPLLFLDRLYVSIGNIMITILVIAYYFVLMRGISALAKETSEAETTELKDSEDSESNSEE